MNSSGPAIRINHSTPDGESVERIVPRLVDARSRVVRRRDYLVTGFGSRNGQRRVRRLAVEESQLRLQLLDLTLDRVELILQSRGCR